MHRLPPLLLLVATMTVLAVVAQSILRAQTGPLPLVGVFEIHLLAAATVLALVALPWAIRRGRGRAWADLVVVAVVAVTVVRTGGELWSPQPAAATSGGLATLTVLTWNLEMGSKAAGTSVEGIAGMDADVVALQELTPDVAAAIEADGTLASRYPFRVLEPQEGVAGMGILSRLPLAALGSEQEPVIQRAALELPGGRTIEVLNVHPYPPGLSLVSRVPVGLDTRRLDEHLGVVAARAGAAQTEAVLVVGDLNTTPTEPGFAVLTQGLIDSHAAVGTGPGFTWRPSSLEGLGLGFLRLDHVLAGSQLTPVAAITDCSIPGDHCRLLVTLRVAAPEV